MLDYREYEPGSPWLIREALVFRSMERGLLADQLRAMLPVLRSTDAQREALGLLDGLTMPWLATGRSEKAEDLVAKYKLAMKIKQEREHNG